MLTRLREESHLPVEGWGKWIWAMVPDQDSRPNGQTAPRGENQEGWMNGNLGFALQQEHSDVAKLCGIYEWRATEFRGSNPRVVYVGSTCARGRGHWPMMQNRIVDYCTHGNHKTDLINDALQRGYELWVRFQPAVDEQAARNMENELLDKYNYAWNIRRNDVRSILP